MGTVGKEKTAVLWNALIEYEKNHEMTDDERSELHEWVLAGNSVHENGSMAYTEYGNPCDFLDIYRYEEEIRSDLAKLSPREQENYTARLCGEDTIDNLREDFNKLLFKTQVYEQVLRSNGLLTEAERKLKTAEEESMKQALQFREWRLANPNEELPFD